MQVQCGMILGFIGAGKMAGALVEGIVRAGTDASTIMVSSKTEASRDA